MHRAPELQVSPCALNTAPSVVTEWHRLQLSDPGSAVPSKACRSASHVAPCRRRPPVTTPTPHGSPGPAQLFGRYAEHVPGGGAGALLGATLGVLLGGGADADELGSLTGGPSAGAGELKATATAITTTSARTPAPTRPLLMRTPCFIWIAWLGGPPVSASHAPPPYANSHNTWTAG